MTVGPEEITKLLKMDGFLKNFTIEVKEASNGRFVIEMPLEEKVMRIGGIMNGGAIMSLMRSGILYIDTLPDNAMTTLIPLNGPSFRTVRSFMFSYLKRNQFPDPFAHSSPLPSYITISE